MITALTGYISDGREKLTCAAMVPLFGYYFYGGYYPVGGSEKLADVLVAAIERRGGVVRLKTRVEKILVEKGRAAGLLLANGDKIFARAIVSNADLKRTFAELVDPALLPADFRRRIEAAAPATSAFMVHLGVDYVPDGRAAIHVHGPNGVGVEVLSKIDPSAAPEGHATVALVRLLPNDEARAWFPATKSEDWKAFRFSNAYSERKRELADAMIAAAEAVLPDLSKHIVHRSEASPITYARYDHASAGSIYGVERVGPHARREKPDPKPRHRWRRDPRAGRRGGGDFRRPRGGSVGSRAAGPRSEGGRGARAAQLKPGALTLSLSKGSPALFPPLRQSRISPSRPTPLDVSRRP